MRDGRKAGSYRALGKIFGPKKGTTNEQFWILHNEEFCSSYKDTDTLYGLNKLRDGGKSGVRTTSTPAVASYSVGTRTAGSLPGSKTGRMVSRLRGYHFVAPRP